MSTKTHGLTRSPEYRSWEAMRSRCYRKKDKSYPKYGGRGIRVYANWRVSFEAFLSHIGPRPPGTTLERIDNNGHYEPGNVRWATHMEQNRNQSINVFLEMDGRRMIARDWAKELGLARSAIEERLKAGWDYRAALTTPKLRGSTDRGKHKVQAAI